MNKEDVETGRSRKLELTKGEKTKQCIFEVSVQLFKTYGYNNVTISEITKACNVSKGTFYTHFNTKADIIAIQFDVIDELYEKYFEKHHFKGFEALEKFLKYVFHIVETVVGKEMLKNLYGEHLLEGSLKTLVREDRNLFIVLRNIVECDEMKNSDPEKVVQASNLIIRGVCYEWSCSGDNENIEDFYVFILENYMTGLKNNAKS